MRSPAHKRLNHVKFYEIYFLLLAQKKVAKKRAPRGGEGGLDYPNRPTNSDLVRRLRKHHVFGAADGAHVHVRPFISRHILRAQMFESR